MKDNNSDKSKLSMKDEARNTERHFSRRPNVRLRESGIEFISAGNMKSDDPAILTEFCELALQENNSDQAQKKTEDSRLQCHDAAQPGAPERNEAMRNPGKDVGSLPEAMHTTGQQSTEPLFFVDVEGDQNAERSEMKPPKLQYDSSVADSSDDEVIFPGRGAMRPVVLTDDSPVLVEAKADLNCKMPTTEGPCSSTSFHRSHAQPQAPDTPNSKGRGTILSFTDSKFSGLSKNSSSLRQDWNRRKSQPEREEDEAVLADYIENVLENSSSEEELSETGKINRPEDSSTWQAQYGERMPYDNGIRVSPNYTSDNADTESENGQTEEVRIFEEAGNAHIGCNVDDRSSDACGASQQTVTYDSSSGSCPENLSSMETFLCEEDAVKGPVEGSSHAWKRAEGTTLSVEELRYKDDATSDVSNDMDYDVPVVIKGWRREHRVHTRRSHFPTANAFADALDEDPYGAFDIMDFDRPSLRKRRKGKRNVAGFGLSNSEIERHIQQTWESDRKKKRLKKQQREELRASGQLGKKAKNTAAGAQTDKLKTEDTINEIRDFLISDRARLSLPPMDKSYRKLVHELANSLSLGSNSKGRGASRFPILTKTARTRTFDSTSITKFDDLISAKGFLRRLGKGKDYQKDRNVISGPRGGTKAASFMDGDVVGASAPEIGVENKGRAMLEKMGWSMGTSLGAVHNKGILQPVTHIVKTNKAGLG